MIEINLNNKSYYPHKFTKNSDNSNENQDKDDQQESSKQNDFQIKPLDDKESKYLHALFKENMTDIINVIQNNNLQFTKLKYKEKFYYQIKDANNNFFYYHDHIYISGFGEMISFYASNQNQKDVNLFNFIESGTLLKIDA